MYEMWKATIQDMLDEGVSPEEIRMSFREQYPEIPELMALVDELSGRIVPGSRVRSFCKTAQETVYNDMGLQSNFSVPNSDGSVGAATPIADDSISGPEGSYKDHVIDRVKQRKEREEEKKRRERRKVMLDKIAIQPGEALRGKTPKGVPKPGEGIPAESTQKVEKEIGDLGSKIENQQVEQKKTPVPTAPKAPGKPAPTTTPGKTPEQKSKDTAKQKKETEELGKTTEQVSKSVDKLDKSLKDLLK